MEQMEDGANTERMEYDGQGDGVTGATSGIARRFTW